MAERMTTRATWLANGLLLGGLVLLVATWLLPPPRQAAAQVQEHVVAPVILIPTATPLATAMAVNPSQTLIPTPAPTTTPVPATATPVLPLLDRIVIPVLELDRAVVPMDWHSEEDALGLVQVWEVPLGAVGHHAGSAEPGMGGNIVMSGHVAGRDPIFPRLIELTPGAAIDLYRGAARFPYRVLDVQRLQEVGVSVAEQQANATLIGATDHEVLTLVTCWPPSGPNAFDQRLIVRALPDW